MKIFISWSGKTSRKVAELFDDWLRQVIQNCDPWVSTKKIESGSQWFTEIGSQLATVNVGVICLTKENKDRPWLLFEAGALLKGLATNRVTPFLIDLEEKDVEQPLASLNMTKPDSEGVFAIVQMINQQLDAPLSPLVLKRSFDTFWPEFETKFMDIVSKIDDAPKSAERTQDEVLGEILNHVRSFDGRLWSVESKASGVEAELRQIKAPEPIEDLHIKREDMFYPAFVKVLDKVTKGLPLEQIRTELIAEGEGGSIKYPGSLERLYKKAKFNVDREKAFRDQQ